MTPTTRAFRLPDGRSLEVLEAGDPDGPVLVLHGGQPSAAVHSPRLDEAARRRGLRLLTWSRPGYGGSDPRAGAYRVRDDVGDVLSVLDDVGAAEFVTVGWSGGGPRALACAALLPGRCRAAAVLAGVAPRDAAGLDWPAGMAEENVGEFAAAGRGAAAYEAYLTTEFLPVLASGPEELATALGGLVPLVDRQAMADGLAPWLAEVFQRAGAQGVRGMRDDGLALVADWGFDPGAITVPTAVWQGEEDTMVPAAHGRWLAAHVPGAALHLLAGEGHLSLLTHLDEVLVELRGMAGW